MVLKTKVCTGCKKEKEITSFERNAYYYYRRICNECHAKKVEKAKIFKIFKKEKLEGSVGKYYSFFCEMREWGVTTDYVATELKDKFKLNTQYATKIAKQFQRGNIEKIIIDYDKNYIRSKI